MLSFDYQGVIWLKSVKVHPPLSTLVKKTQSFISKEKTRTILRQKGMSIDHMDLFVASVAMYNNLTLTSIRRIKTMLFLQQAAVDGTKIFRKLPENLNFLG